MPECVFHLNPLEWKGRPFKPILDHTNGVNSDNRAENLRLLCPNCDSQLDTRGGKNKGKVEKSGGGFAVIRDGTKHYTLPVEPFELKLSFGDVTMAVSQPTSAGKVAQASIQRCRLQSDAGGGETPIRGATV